MAQKILIVDDNPWLTELLGFFLGTIGYETSQAGSSAQALTKALRERPNLIITDLYLPDITAVEAAAILKKNPLTRDIPIVVLTAMPDGEWKEKARKAGVAEYLIKPVQLAHLASIVRRLAPNPSTLTEL